MPSPHAPYRSGFTLVELLVATAVLSLLLVLVAQLLNATATVTSMGSKHMDADAAARALFDRMAIDFAGAVKRADVDYYLKGRPAANKQQGDDQIAFYSEVAGYSSGSPSPISLVAYRLPPAAFRIERLGTGLSWNGESPSDTPVVFLPIPLASPLPSPFPSPAPSTQPSPAWPHAGNMDPDLDYEPMGPQVFRFEYYYVLKGQNATTSPSILSEVPWDIRLPHTHQEWNGTKFVTKDGHNEVDGLKDVAAIGVVIAVIDSKTRVIVSDAQLTALSGDLKDFDSTMKPGDLEAEWQKTISASAIPRVAASALRVYGRTFSLDTASSTR